ncbi:MAG TPA: AsmA-like C-terminal region-containing protein [Lacibacter sp.]|nr:AsmA-like C-terminal region-containing protein [Lacibacter sp.]HMO90163.1 AsmA-like C-terminal region-containing protein [Lacibacter sp.]
MRFRKWIIGLLVLLLAPLLLATGVFVYVYYNQQVITGRLVKALNEEFEGTFKLEKSRVTLFKGFPYVSVDLKGLAFYEKSDTPRPPLYRFDDVYAGFNIKDLLARRYVIKRLQFNGGYVRLHRLEDGSLTLLNAKRSRDTTAATDSTTQMHLELRRIVVRNTRIDYDEADSVRELHADIRKAKIGLRYKEGQVQLQVQSQLELDVWENGKKTFFYDKRVETDLKLNFDNTTRLFTLQPSRLQLNEARFEAAGTVLADSVSLLDLRLQGNKPDFNLLTAFAPPDIAAALNRYKNEGQVYFRATIRGKAGGGHTPAIEAEFGCENAYFLNPGMQKKLDQLQFAGSFTNGPGRSLETSELRLTRFFARPAEGLFEGQLFIRNFTDPYIKLDVHADLDLDFIGKFFQLEALNRISGRVLLDMNFDELVDLNFPTANLARLKKGIDSELTIENLSFDLPGYPLPVQGMNAHAVMRNGQVQLDSLQFRIGKSDLFVSGTLNDLPALFHRFDKPIRSELELRSRLLDIRELLSHDTALGNAYQEEIRDFRTRLSFDTRARELFGFRYLPRGTFTVTGLFAQLQHYPHRLHDVDLTVEVGETDLQFLNCNAELDSSDVHFSGAVINYPKWFQPQPYGQSRYEFRLTAGVLKLHDLLSYKGENYLPPEYRHEVFRNITLAGRAGVYYNKGVQRVELQLDELSANMKVHPLRLEQFRGKAVYRDGQLTIEDFSGRMGASDFRIRMHYHLNDSTATNSFALQSDRLDLDALLQGQGTGSDSGHAEAFNIFALPFPNLDFSATVQQLQYHKYWLSRFHTRLRLQRNHLLYVDTLDVHVAQGDLQLKGYFNGTDPRRIYFNSTLQAHNVELDKLLFKLDNFGQDVLLSDNLKGRVSGQIRSNLLVHPDLTPILEKSEAHLDLTITDGVLLRFAPLQAMSRFFKDKNLAMVRFDTLRNVFDLKNSVLEIPRMQINSSIGFLELEGRQGLDLQMDYLMRLPLRLVTQVGWQALFGGRRQEEVDPEQEDAIQVRDPARNTRFLQVRVTGTPEKYDVQLGRGRRARP